jgi:starch synthase
MPSLEEGFGIPAAEAMGCEKPVVSTDAGGLVEVVEDGVTGIIVRKGSAKELSDGIIKVLSDRKAAEKMGKEGRKRALRLFSWEKTAKNFIKLYEENKK